MLDQLKKKRRGSLKAKSAMPKARLEKAQKPGGDAFGGIFGQKTREPKATGFQQPKFGQPKKMSGFSKARLEKQRL